MKSPLLPSIILLLTLVSTANAQEQPAEGEVPAERVQYALILPDEKNPEMVKPEENNPFEALSEGHEEEGDTEENQVRDILLSMPVGGGVSGPNGMRIMLGGMRLEPGVEVPPVLPDQQVVLKVKDITHNTIELIWVEKKPTGLPPKTLIIQRDSSPRVRYQMPANNSAPGTTPGGSMGILRRDPTSATDITETPTTTAVPVQEQTQKPAALPAPPPANVPEASVLRMLFGNRPPGK